MKKDRIFFLNKISFKKISVFRNLIKIEFFNNSFIDSLGNFIRRTIFLTNYGYKISYIKFFNVNSEYSNLKGVKENTYEIISNLNNILFKIKNEIFAYLIIKKNGPCIVTAKDIFSDKKVIILNPNIVIANITGNVLFYIVMKCSLSSYTLNDLNFKEKFFKSKIIKLNFINSVIKNVNYFIHKKVYNKNIKTLFFDIETNGTLDPEMCFRNCIFFIKKYFDVLFSIIGVKKKYIEIKKRKKFLKINPVLIRSIDNLEISIHTSNVLKRNNIYLIGDLIKQSEQSLINLRFMNKSVYLEIIEALNNKNLPLNMKIKYEIQY
ncbi:DNA-directed RNA polymerase subunit alpha C-terminal domain-containing protein [Candidatus Carsonella ruddii]|uniref:DNA-directed RNA polymerase subunit alpha n=1 Tax=Carsonella ruddii TaxID=114186 RepID=A0AAE7G488_CARRU|nr:DNA-directed RNA polymerase subunit alpha C-terminal domain-containing protein [Candidatus Carsonella ruddii]AGS06651.1 DNA-directed RNA polymerase subunit alpha [Candidatus Carsonella ruddii DC]ALA96887.1 hypothetical protein AMC76_00880 [Candidatus Carsonella ruddii]QLK14123.1 hypothetical protein FK493_00885 [Candidatus Carsonella ruddii]